MQETERQNMGDYLASKSREEFVSLCVAKGMKRDTARRRYYKLRKIAKNHNFQEQRMVPKNEISESTYKIESDTGLIVIPDNFKLIQLTDMKRYKKKINENFLQKNGFAPSDIAWVKFMGIT